MYDNIIAKIVDAGYSVGKSRGGKRSGLDVSKKTPTSLFYLPCQAKSPADSFFEDYKDEKRKILDPMTWVRNSVVQFPQVDDAQKHIQQPKEVDQAAVEKTTMIWRESPKYPGEGNARFFNFAVSLRSAGMPLDQIEMTMRENVEDGNSPKERKDKIPWIMKTLRASLKKICIALWKRDTQGPLARDSNSREATVSKL